MRRERDESATARRRTVEPKTGDPDARPTHRPPGPRRATGETAPSDQYITPAEATTAQQAYRTGERVPYSAVESASAFYIYRQGERRTSSSAETAAYQSYRQGEQAPD